MHCQVSREAAPCPPHPMHCLPISLRARSAARPRTPRGHACQRSVPPKVHLQFRGQVPKVMTHTPQLQPGHDSHPTATARLTKCESQACRAAPEVNMNIQFSGQVPEVVTHTPQLQPGLLSVRARHALPHLRWTSSSAARCPRSEHFRTICKASKRSSSSSGSWFGTWLQSRHTTPQGSRCDTPQGSRRETPQGSRQDTPQGTGTGHRVQVQVQGLRVQGTGAGFRVQGLACWSLGFSGFQ